MDGDLVIGIFMIIVWFISSLIARFGKSRTQEIEMPELEEPPPAARRPGARRPAGAETAPPKVVTVQDALRDLAKQMGVDVQLQPAEPPVASEHVRTAGEHRRTEMETRQSLSERTGSLGEHRRTASETVRTASEGVFEASEHRFSPSEHRRGDLRAPSPGARTLAAPGRVRRGRRSAFARRLQADLAGGGGSLARAIVLREILGPPVGLRSPDDDGR